MKMFLLILSLFLGDISQEHKCLTEAIYFEAGNQSITGKLAVGNVIKNRVKDNRWRDSFCKVVHRENQFAYYSDGKPEKIPRNKSKAERNAAVISNWVALAIFLPLPDITHGSLYYHSTKIKPPHWTRKLKVAKQVEEHILYVDAR